MKEGFIIIHRKIWDNDFWNEKPFSVGQSWIDILLMSNWADKKTHLKGKEIIIKRGEFITSISKLSQLWGWSRHKVSNKLNEMSINGMIEQIRHSHYIVLKVCQYSFYQDLGHENKPKKGGENEQKTSKKTGHKKDRHGTNMGQTLFSENEPPITIIEDEEKNRDRHGTKSGQDWDTTNNITIKQVNKNTKEVFLFLEKNKKIIFEKFNLKTEIEYENFIELKLNEFELMKIWINEFAPDLIEIKRQIDFKDFLKILNVIPYEKNLYHSWNGEEIKDLLQKISNNSDYRKYNSVYMTMVLFHKNNTKK